MTLEIVNCLKQWWKIPRSYSYCGKISLKIRINYVVIITWFDKFQSISIPTSTQTNNFLKFRSNLNKFNVLASKLGACNFQMRSKKFIFTLPIPLGSLGKSNIWKVQIPSFRIFTILLIYNLVAFASQNDLGSRKKGTTTRLICPFEASGTIHLSFGDFL